MRGPGRTPVRSRPRAGRVPAPDVARHFGAAGRAQTAAERVRDAPLLHLGPPDVAVAVTPGLALDLQLAVDVDTVEHDRGEQPTMIVVRP